MRHWSFEDITPEKITTCTSVVIVTSLVIKILLVLISPLNLAPDESYYWEWSRHLDWSYYSKGPVGALLIKLGCLIFGDTELGVRIFYLIAGTLFLQGLRKVLMLITHKVTAETVTILFAVSPFFFALGLGATTDPPCLALLIWAIYYAIRSERASSSPSANVFIALAGFLFGLSALTKLTSSIVVLLWLASLVIQRKNFQTIIIAASAAALPLLPLLYWNYQHDWINLLHNAGHLTGSEKKPTLFINTLNLLLSQVGLFGPVQCFALYYLFKSSHSYKFGNPWYLSAGLLAFVCIVTSIQRPVYANWPIPIFPLVFVGLLISSNIVSAALNEKLIKLSRYAGVILVMLLVVGLPVLMGVDLGYSAKSLPVKKLIGWQSLSAAVDKELASADFVYVTRYDVGSSIAFYSKYHPEIVCGAVTPRRMNQYDLWNTWETTKGKDAIIVLESKEYPAALSHEFEKIEYLRAHEVKFHDKVIKILHIFRGMKFNGTKPRFDRVV